ncbi:MAG: hypothetical protein D6695_09730 [Planctomycetota bacterium]|nr:MAG: hypothetical protein D6695_09730 [Planctomycetota bacterium]
MFGATVPILSPRRAMVLMLAAGLAAPWGSVAAGQPESMAAPGLVDFSQVEIPLAPVQGMLRFQADRAFVWREGSVQRLVLERDVRVDLGPASFEAARAVIWLRRLGAGTEPVYQVFAYMERVRTPSADAAVSIDADALPVRAVIAAKPRLAVDVRVPTAPQSEGALRPEEATLAAMAAAERALARALVPEPPLEPEVERIDQPEPAEPEPQPETEPPGEKPSPREPATEQIKPSEPSAGKEEEAQRGQSGPVASPEPSPVSAALFRPEGVFYVAAGERVVVRSGEFDSAVIITGGIVVQYDDGTESLELTAQRGVVFLKPGPLAERLSSFSAEDVYGLYLEGEVRATNGKYTFRAPRIYYDVERDRALALDAVFWTYDQRLGMPLYLRADAIRQEAVNQFSARKATLSNTAFFNPEFSIGVGAVSVEQRERDDGSQHLIMDARNVTLKAGPVPFFWWPRYHGDPERIPIRNLGYRDTNRTGGVITSKWDAFTLLGIEPWRDLNAMIEIDTYFDRGLGLGIDLDWAGRRGQGDFYGYTLPDDDGVDVTARGTTIDRDDQARGLAFFRHRVDMPEGWTILLEASYASDEAFVQALFPEIAEESRELTTRVHVRKTNANGQFYAEVEGAVNDFIIPEHQMQAPGYMVDKLPEIGYISIAEDLLPETLPGLLSYTWQASYAQMRFRFSEVDASSLGYTRDVLAQRAFGIDSDQSLGDLYRSMGLDESLVNRFDTRHEVSAQLQSGQILVTPFVVGRVTIYDDDFQAFSPDESDNVRLWGGAGVTLATSIHHIDRSIESDLFDLHELRHIIEPSVTLFHADTTIDRVDLPVYDDEVEALNEGSTVRLRLGQTWQTKRGGPGRWRSVDLLEFNAEYVWHSADTDPTSPIGRFYTARPELSVPGEYLRAESVLRLTEVVALAGETIYDLRLDQPARSSIGALIEHTPDFRTTAEIRYLNSQNVTYGRLGAQYRLTDKYRFFANTTYNFDREDFQTFSFNFLRRFTIGELGLQVIYNNIRGETSLGFTFTPFGQSSARIGGAPGRGTASESGFGS